MSEGIDTGKFIDVLQSLHQKIDDGFQGVYDRMAEDGRLTSERVNTCRKRFQDIEMDISQSSVANGIDRADREEKRNTWLYVVRGLMLAGFLALCGLLYEFARLSEMMKRAGIAG